MKTHVRNGIFASLAYIAVFICVVTVAMVSDIGVSFFIDEETNPDTIIFIASVFFTYLASFAVYCGFYLFQRNEAKNNRDAKFLGLFPRILGAVIACAVSCGVVFFCLPWTSDYGEDISILYANTTLLGIIISVAVAVNFAVFIVLKPRV
ncbi:MAG: hypothetical protein LBG87_01370 [Spirochaetaceae bacterium]|jgi:peptidoglycan biosynthesis protein MviN/MurJ (putative lipid II flippase)|nr:hypothetical protein [Spirochaetaceae bacterium]